MNLRSRVTEIVITFIIAFVRTRIDSGEVGILKALLTAIIFLAMFYVIPRITNRKRK